jgi:hypothetical protein
VFVSEAFSELPYEPSSSVVINAHVGSVIFGAYVGRQVEEHVEIFEVASENGPAPQIEWHLLDVPLAEFAEPEALGFMLHGTR